MSTKPTKKTEYNKSFFRNLLERRVPQILGVYLAIGWGILEFTDWLVSRYKLSPYLTDLTVVILISLTPSILMIAYFHGKPGKDKWNLVEKVGIPANIIFTVFLLFFAFSGKDLGSVEQTITLKNEIGQEIQRTIPKKDFKKGVALFYFDPLNETNSENWMIYGITYMLEYDLSQDLFFYTLSPSVRGGEDFDYFFYRGIKAAGYNKGLQLPFRLKQKIARDYNLPYFLGGEFKEEQGNLTVTTNLYDTKRGKLIATNSFTGDNIFKLTDQISTQLKIDLGLSKSVVSETNDLPLEEIFTKSIEAARLFTLAKNTKIFERDWDKAEDYLEESIQKDPAFAYAMNELSLTYVFNNKTDQWKKLVDLQGPLMKNIYKLPERMQYMVKLNYYQSIQDLEKQIALVDILIKLNPDDVQSMSIRAQFHNLNNEYDSAIGIYKKILEIDSTMSDLYTVIGKLYQKQGKYKEAMRSYSQFSQHHPDDPAGFRLIGNLYNEMGEFKEAKINFDKALLIDPADINNLILLGDTQINLGDYPKALGHYQEALNLSSDPKSKARVYKSISAYYRERGEIRKAMINSKLRDKNIMQYSLPLVAVFNSLDYIDDYATCGKVEEGLKKIKEMGSKLNPPFDQLLNLGYISLYLQAGDLKMAKTFLPKVESTIKAFGYRQLKLAEYEIKGEFYRKTKEYEKSLEFFQKKLKFLPNRRELLRYIGNCYRSLKQFGKAKESLDAAIKFKPFNPYINFEMAEYYFDIKKNDEGLKYLNIALDIWKDADHDFPPALKAKGLKKKYSAD